MSELQRAIESFVQSCRQPALSEPGEELIELSPGNWSLEERNGAVLLQAWDRRRNLVRKIVAVDSETRAKLTLKIERFGKKPGTLLILDLKRPGGQTAGLRTARLEFREIFRRFLRREFSDFRIAELSTEPNLEHSLSPAYPRALLRHGSTGWAAIGAAPEAAADFVLSFGLIWLDYLRLREPGLSLRGLVLFLPSGQEKNTCLRLRFLNPDAALFSVFVYNEDGHAEPVDLRDYGNTDTHLEPCRRDVASDNGEIRRRLSEVEDVETIEAAGGVVSFRVRGLEFARLLRGQLTWGLETKRVTAASHISEIQSLARELARFRAPDAADRHHPLYLRNPEAWLESQVRRRLEEVDPSLCLKPIYGQVPAFASGERGVIDLLAADGSGRLAVLELKASQDIHLPLQALDYWVRVKWHLDRDEFAGNGYFPEIRIRRDPPRLLLVAPALEFHPSNERVLRFFSPQVEVERFGVGLEWQQRLKLMFRV